MRNKNNEWKTIKGFKRYQINKKGEIRVKNYIHKGAWKVVTPLLDEEGNEFVILQNPRTGASQIFYVDELIQMFNEEISNDNVINEEIQEEVKEEIEEIEEETKEVYCVELDKVFKNAKEAAIELKINQASITKCCKGYYKRAGKLHWKYVK